MEIRPSLYREAARDLALKIKLESSFSIGIKGILTDITKEFAEVYGASGRIISIYSYHKKLSEFLKIEYNTISRDFRNNLSRNFAPSENLERFENEVVRTLEEFTKAYSVKQADALNVTTDNDLRALINKEILARVEAGEEFTKEEIAEAIEERYLDFIEGRSDLIATTEVNTVAETAKYTEAQALTTSALIIGGVAVRNMVRKTWHARFDTHTRIGHARASGQTVAVAMPFIVTGEPLQYPGDPNGSAGNIIRCRCFLTYEIM